MKELKIEDIAGEMLDSFFKKVSKIDASKWPDIPSDYEDIPENKKIRNNGGLKTLMNSIFDKIDIKAPCNKETQFLMNYIYHRLVDDRNNHEIALKEAAIDHDTQWETGPGNYLGIPAPIYDFMVKQGEL